jgi:predicted N-acetyltransferase YhbS
VNTEPLGPIELLAEDHLVDQFDSGVVELDRWLNHSARVAQAAGTAATYVVARGRRVVDYYALAMSSVEHDGAPSRLRRGMPDPVPVVLLGRLAVDRVEQGHQLGGHLLVDALKRCTTWGTRVRGSCRRR